MINISDNCEFKKNIRESFRAKTIIFMVAITAIIMFIIISIIGSGNAERNEMNFKLFSFTAWVYLIISCIYVVSVAVRSILDEKENKTFELLILTPMNNYNIIYGKIISSVVKAIFELGVLLPFILLFSALSGIPFLWTIYFIVNTIAWILCISSVGVFASSLLNSKRSASFVAIILCALIIFVLGYSAFPYKREIPSIMNIFTVCSPGFVLCEIGQLTVGVNSYAYPLRTLYYSYGIPTIILSFLLYAYIINVSIRFSIKNLRGNISENISYVEILQYFAIFILFVVGFGFGDDWNKSPLFLLYAIFCFVFQFIAAIIILPSKDVYLKSIKERVKYGSVNKNTFTYLKLIKYFIFNVMIIFLGVLLAKLGEPGVSSWSLLFKLVMLIILIFDLILIMHLMKIITKRFSVIITVAIFTFLFLIIPLLILISGNEDIYIYLSPLVYLVNDKNAMVSSLNHFIHLDSISMTQILFCPIMYSIIGVGIILKLISLHTKMKHKLSDDQ